MKLLVGVLIAAAMAACGGKSQPASTPAPSSETGSAASSDAEVEKQIADCVAACVADGGPKDASGAPLEPAGTAPADLERPCQEQCGGLEPSPAAMDGYDDTP